MIKSLIFKKKKNTTLMTETRHTTKIITIKVIKNKWRLIVLNSIIKHAEFSMAILLKLD